MKKEHPIHLLAVQLTEGLQVIHSGRVAHQVEENVLKSARVTIGENKAIAVGLASESNNKHIGPRCQCRHATLTSYHSVAAITQ
jgi:hypothetical protein